MAKRTMTLADVQTILASDLPALIVDCIHEHGARIEDELYTIRNHPDAVAHALIMSNISPRQAFESNMRAVPYVMHALRDLTGNYDDDVVYVHFILSLHHIGLAPKKADWLVNNADRIMSMTFDDMLAETVRTLKGFGPKVSAFGIHPIRPDAKLYTLDTWMLRGLAVYAGVGTARDTWEIAENVYKVPQDGMLAVCEEVGCLPFVSQWSLWNRFYRFENKHMSHLPAFA